MDRLTMLEKARQLACDQIMMSSCLTDDTFDSLNAEDDERALYILAEQFLSNAAVDIELGS